MTNGFLVVSVMVVLAAVFLHSAAPTELIHPYGTDECSFIARAVTKLERKPCEDLNPGFLDDLLEKAEYACADERWVLFDIYRLMEKASCGVLD